MIHHFPDSHWGLSTLFFFFFFYRIRECFLPNLSGTEVNTLRYTRAWWLACFGLETKGRREYLRENSARTFKRALCSIQQKKDGRKGKNYLPKMFTDSNKHQLYSFSQSCMISLLVMTLSAKILLPIIRFRGQHFLIKSESHFHWHDLTLKLE